MDNQKTVLVVEDDKFLAKAYLSKLSKAGFSVKITQNGEEAFEALNHFNPSLILLDLVMPKKDGFAVLEELKKNETYKDIPVLIVSNLGQDEDIQRGKDLGADGYLIKTDITLDELIQKINEVLV